MTDPEITSIAAEILDSVSTDYPELQGRLFGEVLLKIVERGLYTGAPGDRQGVGGASPLR